MAEETKRHLILTNPNRETGDLDLFIGDDNAGKHHSVSLQKQVLWLRLISNSISRYLEKNV